MTTRAPKLIGMALLALAAGLGFILLTKAAYRNSQQEPAIASSAAQQNPVRAQQNTSAHKADDVTQARQGADSFSKVEPLANASIERRQSYYDSSVQHNSMWLINQWRVVVNSTDDVVTNGLLSRALSFRLQADPNEKAAYVEGATYLLDSSNSIESRIELVKIMGRAATAGALQVLVDTASDALRSKDLEPEISIQISKIGENRWGNKFHPELTEIYEQALARAPINSNMAAAALSGLASVGSMNAVSRLITDILNVAKTTDELAAHREDRNLSAALSAVEKIRNPESIPVLVKGLRDQDSKDMELLMSGAGLSTMGDPKATEALLKWAQLAREDMAPLARTWFARTRDTASFEVIERALGQQVPFSSPKVKAEIQTVLDKRNEMLKKMFNR